MADRTTKPRPVIKRSKNERDNQVDEGRKLLNKAEQKRLAELETKISTASKKTLEQFQILGGYLEEIRDNKLYQGTHKNFEDYCEERWCISRSYAHRLIQAAVVMKNLLPIGDKPTAESQVRELVRLKDPEEQARAWQKAVDETPDGRPTAKVVKNIVESFMPERSTPTKHSLYIELDEFTSDVRKIIREHKEKIDVNADMTEIERVFDRAKNEIETLIEKAVNQTNEFVDLESLPLADQPPLQALAA